MYSSLRKRHGDGIAIKNPKGRRADAYSRGERDQPRNRHGMLRTGEKGKEELPVELKIRASRS